MNKKPAARFRVSKLRALLAFLLIICAALLAALATVPPVLRQGGLRLAISHIDLNQRSRPRFISSASFAPSVLAPVPGAPTFGHPVISGIGGRGYEEDLRLDPVDPNRLYTSVPAALAADTSWIWHSLDGGKTFKWVVGATALQGKVTTCHGGGDTELAVDSAQHLYFNDLTLANFSTARSDDFGATFAFTCNSSSALTYGRLFQASQGYVEAKFCVWAAPVASLYL